MYEVDNSGKLVNKINKRPLTEQMIEEGLCRNHQHMDIDYGARSHFVPSFQAPYAHPIPFSNQEQKDAFMSPFLKHLEDAITAWDSLVTTKFFKENLPSPEAINNKARRAGTNLNASRKKSKTSSLSGGCCDDDSEVITVVRKQEQTPNEKRE